jgi:Flp pilus assembly protein TadG
MSAARTVRSSERGATALLVALLAVVLVGVLAFVSDFGTAYANQRSLQNGADAAALAVGRQIAVNAPPNQTCTTIKNAYNTPAMRTAATGVFAKNVEAGAALSTGVPGFEVACEQVGTTETLVVKVAGEQQSPSFFGGIFGRSSVPVAKSAKVIVGPLGAVVGLRPFAICDQAADFLALTPGTVFTYRFDNATAGCGYAPGNWGLLDFNGGSNPTGEIADWLHNGYNEPIANAPPIYLPGNPGAPNPGGLEAEMDFMMTLGDIVLPVFDDLTGTGSASQFRISGFISVTPCGWKFNNKSGNNPACFLPPPSPVPSDYLQVKFSAYVPVGEVNLACALGTDACDNGPRGTALAD